MSELVHLLCNRKGQTCSIFQSRSIKETEFGLGESIHYFMEVGVIDNWWCGCFRGWGQVKDGVWFLCEPRRSSEIIGGRQLNLKLRATLWLRWRRRCWNGFFASSSNSLAWKESSGCIEIFYKKRSQFKSTEVEWIDPSFSTEAESWACAEGCGGDTKGCSLNGFEKS